MEDQSFQPEKQKHPGGRPSKRDQVDLGILVKLAAVGLTNEQISKFFEIDITTFYAYNRDWPEFSHAIKTNRPQSDDLVVTSLYQRALGYQTPTKNYPPDTTACIFWLKNRRPNEWRDTYAVESRFVFEFVSRVGSTLNNLLPDNCPHCKKALTLRDATIRELERLSKELEAVPAGRKA